MTSNQTATIEKLQQVIPGNWKPFDELSVEGYHLALSDGVELVVCKDPSQLAPEEWTAIFCEDGEEPELKLSSLTTTVEEAVSSLVGRARRLTMLTCRSGDTPIDFDDYFDQQRSSLYGLFDSLLTRATIEHATGRNPKGSTSLQAEGS